MSFYKKNSFKTDFRALTISTGKSKNVNETESSLKYKEPETSQILTTDRKNPVEPITVKGNLDVIASLQDLNKSKGYYCNLTNNFLANPDFLKLAYHHIKNKVGNLTKGTTKITLDGLSNN